MTFAAQSRYNIMLHKVYKGGGSAITNIKRFHDFKALKISVGNSYTKYWLMDTFLENIQQGGLYYDCISSHQVEMRREAKLADQKSISISDLQIY